MKISQFEVKQYSIPFIQPLQTAGKTYTHRDGTWLNINWDDFSGWGEAAPLAGFSRESLQEAHYALEGFHQAIDSEILDTEEFLALAHVHTHNIPSARFAVETAIYDLLAQEAGIPLAKYLNSNSTTEVKLNGINGVQLPGDGFQIIKVKVGFLNLFDQIDQMEALTQSYGTDISFRLDANGVFD